MILNGEAKIGTLWLQSYHSSRGCGQNPVMDSDPSQFMHSVGRASTKRYSPKFVKGTTLLFSPSHFETFQHKWCVFIYFYTKRLSLPLKKKKKETTFENDNHKWWSNMLARTSKYWGELNLLMPEWKGRNLILVVTLTTWNWTGFCNGQMSNCRPAVRSTSDDILRLHTI